MRKQIYTEELKQIQMDILQAVHNFCVNQGITYFLSSGTLLGAVRHKGYIPWDDDIDIYLPRDSYCILIESFNGSKEASTNYRIVDTSMEKQYPYPFAKVEDVRTIIHEDYNIRFEIGINIDVFPIDGVPDNDVVKKMFLRRVFLRRWLAAAKIMRFSQQRSILKNTILAISKFVTLPFSHGYLVRRVVDAIPTDVVHSKYVYNYAAGNMNLTSCFERSLIEESTDIEFEGQMYKTMAGYDGYLRKTYGDYMQLPPEDQQVSHHTFDAYWR